MASQPDSTGVFPQLRRQALGEVRAAGRGVVLIDHFARSNERASVLHAAGCKWLGAVGDLAVVRFVEDEREAVRWLRRNRGEEGTSWKRCRGCGGRAREAAAVDPALRFSIGDSVRIQAPHPTVGRIAEAASGRYVVEMFLGPGTTPASVTAGPDGPSRHSAQSRDFVWAEQGGAWERGTVESVRDDRLLLDADGTARNLPAKAARIRDFRALSAPINLLAEGWAGSADAV